MEQNFSDSAALLDVLTNLHGSTLLTVYYKLGKSITSLSTCASCLVSADVVCKYVVYVSCTYFQLKVVKIVSI